MLELLTVDEVAERLKISKRSTYKLFHRPDFPLIRIGSKLLVKESDLEEYLDDYKGGKIIL